MKISRGKALLILGIVLVIIDQIIKFAVKTNMSLGEHFSVLGDWFQILFVENKGMAFGMSFGGLVGKFLLSFFRVCLFGLLCVWITKLNRKGAAPTGVLVGLTLITAGALGNIIDCLFYGQLFSESLPGVVASFGGSYAPIMFGKVVDMFYFPLIHGADGRVIFFSPVFNFADSCVTVGAFYLILFHYKFFSSEDKSEKDAEKNAQ
ncbi:MAG: signal peptidase II [Bacteroidales bacterium]|nr:signal peptidase II [Bacteroidales bacterium]